MAYAYNFLDRQVIAVALEAIKHDLTLSDTQLGILTGAAFAVFYSVVGLPIARWADRGNRSSIIALSLALLSVTVALCGAVSNFVQLMFVRVGVGTAEAGIVPPAHSLIASYYNRAERLRAMSIFLLGGPLSMAVGYLAGGWITQWFGWRAAFLSLAIPGVILTVMVRTTVRDPRSHGASASVPTRAPLWAGVRSLCQQPTFRILLISFVLDALCGNGLLQWLPVFFIRVHHMATGELGTWLRGPGKACEGSRLAPLTANGAPAFAQWRRRPDGSFYAWCIHVLRVSDGRIAGIDFFVDDKLFALFDQPVALDA